MSTTADLKLIVGHRRPTFPIWSGHRFACFRRESRDDFVIPRWGGDMAERYDSSMSEYYYLFAMRRVLDASPPYDTIAISQYRRFVANRAMGAAATNQPFARVIDVATAGQDEVGELIQAKAHGWLISSIWNMFVTSQYAKSHILRDWYRFLADAQDGGALAAEDVAGAGLEMRFLPSSSIGVFPAIHLREILVTLEACAITFAHGGFVERGGYQRRVIGFCLERLQSYLILKTLARLGIDPKEVSGTQIVVNAGRVIGAPTV